MRARFTRAIEAVCDWYCRVFGSDTAFAVSLVALLGWLAPIPVMGFARWNATVGLGGNNIESTGEWFFAVATLVVATKMAARQREEQDRDRAARQAQEQHRQEQADRMEALQRSIREDLAQEVALLHQALGITPERRQQLLAESRELV